MAKKEFKIYFNRFKTEKRRERNITEYLMGLEYLSD
jgi:hypothetical protein